MPNTMYLPDQGNSRTLRSNIEQTHQEAISLCIQQQNGVDVTFHDVFERASDLRLQVQNIQAYHGDSDYSFKASLPLLLDGLESIVRQIKGVVPCSTYH